MFTAGMDSPLPAQFIVRRPAAHARIVVLREPVRRHTSSLLLPTARMKTRVWLSTRPRRRQRESRTRLDAARSPGHSCDRSVRCSQPDALREAFTCGFLQFIYSLRGKPHGRICYNTSWAVCDLLEDSSYACAGAAPRATRAVGTAVR
jgi:hypothetical protein